MGGHVHHQRSDAEEQIAQLLQRARRKLGLSVAFMSRIDETARTMQVVESDLPGIEDGYTGPRDSGFCLAVVEQRLPRVIPDVRDVPPAMLLHPEDLPQIRGHISVPVVLSDGAVYGTFCAFGLVSDPEVSDHDLAVMEVLGEATAMVIEPQVRLEQRRAEIADRLAPVLTS
ncbi:MAG: GAF domain-containing protein, partial [Actinomycetes bacterium]